MSAVTRIDHIDLRVPSIIEAEGFFTAIGFGVVRRMPERGSIELALPGDAQVVLEVREDATLAQTVVDHIALAVTDSASALATLKEAGLTFDKEAHLVVATGRTVSNFRDPGGGKWQLSDVAGPDAQQGAAP